MERTFIRLPSFEKAWKTLGLGEDAYAELEEMLLLAPKAGAVIEGSAVCGKSGLSFREEAKAAASVSFTWISWWTKRFICSMPIPSP